MTTRRARKRYPCAYDPSHEIDPGDLYQEVVYPPWTPIVEDPEEGPSPLGRWERTRFHGACQAAVEAGYVPVKPRPDGAA